LVAEHVRNGSNADTCANVRNVSKGYWAAMPNRRLTDQPDDLQWCIKCRKVLGDYGGWFGGQCFCHVPPPKPRDGPIGPWGYTINQ
jgi:hypothetical protein